MTPPDPAYGVIAVRYGERETRLSNVYYGWPLYGDADQPVRMTYYFWILEAPTGPPVVIDTGYDPEFAQRMGRDCLCTPADALTRLGVDCRAVENVVITHLHYDHIGNTDLFPNAQFTVARRELDFWSQPVAHRFHFAHHTDFAAVDRILQAAAEGRVRAVDATLTVAPGVVATCVGGHSPGQLVVSISTAGAGVLLTSDAVHYYDEFAGDRPFAVVHDLAAFYTAFDLVRSLARGGRDVVPAHDPIVMERYPSLEGPGSSIAVRIA